MPTINSPLGSKTYQGGMKEFVVPDETMQEEVVNPYSKAAPPVTYSQESNAIRESLEAEKRMMNAREGKISPAAKKRIEMLCGMSASSREVNIDNNIFLLKSLKSKDNRQALTDAVKFDGTVEFSFELRKQILARSLDQIAGVDIDSFLGTSDFNAKLDLIDELDEAVLERLYNEYLVLTKEIKEKYTVKTEGEVKELVEDLKK